MIYKDCADDNKHRPNPFSVWQYLVSIFKKDPGVNDCYNEILIDGGSLASGLTAPVLKIEEVKEASVTDGRTTQDTTVLWTEFVAGGSQFLAFLDGTEADQNSSISVTPSDNGGNVRYTFGSALPNPTQLHIKTFYETQVALTAI